MKKRVLLGASYSVIEPLGLLHLGGGARDLGWERMFHLVEKGNFDQFFSAIEDFRPDVVGFNVYTGNHRRLFEAFEKIRTDHPGITTVLGGPHATYFPIESAKHSDFVVMGEGFRPFNEILRGEAKPGILFGAGGERFPHPDRRTFYRDHPEHARSKIKSVISMTGCPYTCSYCYNSSTLEDIGKNIPPDLIADLGRSGKGRLFPHNQRELADVIREGEEIATEWPTEVVYFQDDVHGIDTSKGGWLEGLAREWPKRVDLPYHAQMRWEMTVGRGGEKRLDLIKEAGCFGLTLAIEAGDFTVRKEILNRPMPERTMFEGMKACMDRGLKVRTEQITGLPYGATTIPTRMNLDADLELLELNVNLRKKTGGPTMAWASTLVPYPGTRLGTYCEQNGYYGGGDDLHETFFEKSVLRFPKRWVGPELAKLKGNENLWLEKDALERYRNQNSELRRHFNFFALLPEGHKLAEAYLKGEGDFSHQRLGSMTQEHLQRLSKHDVSAASILERAKQIKPRITALHPEKDALARDLDALTIYFASLPKGDMAAKRVTDYAKKKGEEVVIQNTLSTAVRHHLYDEVLYSRNVD